MAGARIIFPEFRDEQSDSKYPFADTATLKTNGDELILPRNGFIDAVIYTINSDQRAYLSRVVVDGNTVKIVVGSESSTEICSAEYSPITAQDAEKLYLRDVYGRPAGLLLLTADCLALLGGWPFGEHTFDMEDAEFVSTVVIPALEPCVRAIQDVDEVNFLTGDVWLIGGDGVVVRQDGDEVIKIDINGEPLFKRLLCEGTVEDYNPGPFLQTINGCGPDEYGNFNITVATAGTPDTILRIYPFNGQLKIGLVGKRVV